MTSDPVVEELRRIRDALAKEHGYDIRAIVKALQSAEKSSGRQLVALPPKRLPDNPADRKAL
jgi:hypothetical protein